MRLPYIALVAAAHRTNLNLVFQAMGWGPETFMRKVCVASPSATPTTPPTHWLSSNASASDADVAMINAMTEGNLPALPMGTVWGEDGVISAADAMAASDGAVFQVYSAAGDIEPVDHVAAVLLSRGLQYVPDGPI